MKTIGPLWCQQLEGWIRFSIEGNHIKVDVAVKETPTKATEWHQLEGAKGPWTVYYSDGEKDIAPVTYYLENNILYRTEGRINNHQSYVQGGITYTYVYIDSLTPEKPEWSFHNPIKSSNPFPNYKKEDISLTPFHELPLTSEQQLEAVAKKEAEQVEHQQQWLEWKKKHGANWSIIEKTVAEKYPEFLAQLFKNQQITVDPKDLVDIHNELIDQVKSLAVPLVDGTQTAREYLVALKESAEAPSDSNQWLQLAAWTHFQEAFTVLYPALKNIKLFAQIKRDYFLLLLKEEGNYLAEQFKVDIDFSTLAFPVPSVNTVNEADIEYVPVVTDEDYVIERDTNNPDESDVEFIAAIYASLDQAEQREMSSEVEELTEEERAQIESANLQDAINRSLHNIDNNRASSVGDFAPANTNAEELTSQQKVEAIVQAVTQSQQNYSDWYNKKPGTYTRADNGFFTWFRHTTTGQNRAAALSAKVVECSTEPKSDDEKLEFITREINEFLCDERTNYHIHSFSSFLLDELTKIKDSTWDGLTQTGKHYNKAEIIEKFSNNDVKSKIHSL
ncbi:hypothetical protein [Legionella hackeliae]|uniref:Uncharacterized protein n=1 Tax=Legionella hackeliae TaxID=449 RepID=A0A0A8UKV9_LEGHA|nr:hypothetical protein [Legionella hackeliae]KTD14874.1 hypothetical protein Lhac_0404 [Legionella hackeliae]CEK09500.1 protein of unknown function [Legionella hackeliae]STX49407.1 Uncharacterised protein [Legionella hackeliae]